MADKQTSRGRKQDRARVAGGQDYEVRYEAKEDRQVESRSEAGGQAGWQQPKARGATPCPTVSNRSSCGTAWTWVSG